jgi:hypothetical protein
LRAGAACAALIVQRIVKDINALSTKVFPNDAGFSRQSQSFMSAAVG